MRRPLSPIVFAALFGLSAVLLSDGKVAARDAPPRPIGSSAEQASQRLGQLGAAIVARERRLNETRQRLQARRREASAARIRLADAEDRLRRLGRAAQRLSRQPAPAVLLHPDKPLDAARSAMLLRRISEEVATQNTLRRKEMAKLETAIASAERAESLLHADLRRLRAEEAEVRRLQNKALGQRLRIASAPRKDAVAPKKPPMKKPSEAQAPRKTTAPTVVSAPVPKKEVKPKRVAAPKQKAEKPLKKATKKNASVSIARAQEKLVKSAPKKVGEKKPRDAAKKTEKRTPSISTASLKPPGVAPKSQAKVRKQKRPKEAASYPALAHGIPATKRFAKSRGQLLWPTAGDMRRSGRRAEPGVSFFTEPYARVIAPWRGVVRHIGSFGSGEKIVIIEPQKGYSILFTGMGTIDVSVGQKLTAGQPIGRMSGPAQWREEFLFEERAGAMKRSEKLYLEIYRNDVAMDSAPWFRSATERVSGL